MYLKVLFCLELTGLFVQHTHAQTHIYIHRWPNGLRPVATANVKCTDGNGVVMLIPWRDHSITRVDISSKDRASGGQLVTRSVVIHSFRRTSLRTVSNCFNWQPSDSSMHSCFFFSITASHGLIWTKHTFHTVNIRNVRVWWKLAQDRYIYSRTTEVARTRCALLRNWRGKRRGRRR